MAATTKLLQLRPKTLPTTTSPSPPTSIHFFSSSSNTTPDPNNKSSPQPNQPPPPSPPPEKSQSPFASYFSDVKASLKQTNPQSPTPRKTFSFGSSISNQPNPPSKIESFEEIRRNLSEFRLRSAAPPPPPIPPSSTSNSTSPPHSPRPISFQDLYQRSVASRGERSTLDASKTSKQLSFDAIRESLRQLKSSIPVKNQGETPLSKFKESLRFRQADPSTKPSQRVFGGSDHLPLSIFGRELQRKEEGDATDVKNRTEFLRTYGFTELGKMLRELRPEKRDKTDWFSFDELNERLVKLREMEEKEKENDSGLPSATFRELRDGLAKLKVTNEEKASKSPWQRLDILGQLGRTPGYMLSPPKEELVEKYFHPDNMSASEKLKLELKKVRDEFKMSESDCGSARVQVAQLTTKIKHLSTALHKKDKHSRKGLQAMVQRRKKLLKYLRRTDWDSYCFVLSKLGLRDNPDYKC